MSRDHPTAGRSGAGETPAPLVGCYGRTVVVAVAVLFAVLGSVGDVAATDAVFVIVPLLVGFTMTVMVTDAPFAMVPMTQLTTFLDGLIAHDPWVAADDP